MIFRIAPRLESWQVGTLKLMLDLGRCRAMHFRVRHRAFAEAALLDLRHCCDSLLDRAKKPRTSLGHHAADAEARELIVAAARRFYESELPRLFAERFGSIPALNLGFTTIRLQEPAANTDRVGWHLDLNFAYDGASFLVAWVPMEDVGTSRAGLEVCAPKSSIDIRPLLDAWQARKSAARDLVFGDEELDAMFGIGTYKVRALKLAAGDAAVFDQYVLHRTQILPEASEARRSFEFRMVDIRALPKLSALTDGMFCRPDRNEPGGIEFIVKAGKSVMRADSAVLDRLDIGIAGKR